MLFVIASVVVHVGLVAAAPSLPLFAAELPEHELVYMDLAPEAPEVEATPIPEEEPVVEEPEPVPEAPAPVEEPEPADETPIEEPSEASDTSLAETAQGGAEAAETVASSEGGLAVDRAAGSGREGAAHGATRTEPLEPNPNALRQWRLSAMRALGRPEPTLALRRTGQEGIAWVAFQIDEAGQVVAVRLYRSSGHELVDEAALAFARSRHALPRPPAPWNLRWVRLPIRYRAEPRG